MYYDLHIHSGLSPCADDDMSPQNIVRMAILKGLQLISICDHNSLKQQAVLAEVAKAHHLKYLYGIELQTKEEVHVLAYFKDPKDLEPMQTWLNHVQMKVQNRPNFFGHQYLYDQHDHIVDEENIALIFSLNATLTECLHMIHLHHGKAVLAHVYGRKNGIVTQLGFIPNDLEIDGIEVSQESDLDRLHIEYPAYSHLPLLINSDAHSLINIHEAVYELNHDAQKRLWGT